VIESCIGRQFGRSVLCILAISLVTTSSLGADDSKEAWAALVKGGHVALIRQAFRNHGVRVDRILSSPWCRCLETARLMAAGPVESSWALVPDREPSSPVRLLELKEMVSTWRGPGTLVLVTHALTVRPLIGILPNQGEIVVLRPGSGSPAGADLVGRIAAPR
jgi:hypothetical protein